MTGLHSVLLKLGLAQYFDKFSEEGFETWEIVLDITESDLDALGVKLGHRRILQREIAFTRGVPADQLLSPGKSGGSQDGRASRPAEDSRIDGKSSSGTGGKRKYRRHPKNDENAPEKPPSAYVIFSNKIREELKPECLSFTAIAKRVGERWQDLPAEEKEPFESEASTAKEKYHTEMAEYKTTKSYREYQQYLAGFKAKNNSALDEKRPKLVQEESTASSASIASHLNDTLDSLSGHSDSKKRRVDSMSSVGPYSTTSGFPSPASIMAGPPALRTGIAAMIPLGNASPISPSQPTSLVPRDSSNGPALQSAGHVRPSVESYIDQAAGSVQQNARYPSHESREIQQTPAQGFLAGPYDLRQSRGRTSPLDLSRRPARVPSLLQANISDASSKSSMGSTLSSSSTASSSLFPPVPVEEGKKTAMSLPPLAAVTLGSYGGSSVYADSAVARQQTDAPAIQPTSQLAMPKSSQSPFGLASSTGMKFESLQLPLPYNISFGQRPLPRPEHEKLANIFDLQDIPGERSSLKNLTLQKEQEPTADVSPIIAQGPPEPRHPPHVPQLPTLPPLTREDTQENILHPNADPLSVLAFAGRLVGRESRRPS